MLQIRNVRLLFVLSPVSVYRINQRKVRGRSIASGAENTISRPIGSADGAAVPKAGIRVNPKAGAAEKLCSAEVCCSVFSFFSFFHLVEMFVYVSVYDAPQLCFDHAYSTVTISARVAFLPG